MSHDGAGPPAGNGARFPFLKRGAGHTKFEKINYITPKPTSAMPRPSASSSSAAPHSTSSEEAPRRPAAVPRLDLHSPTTDAQPQSGKDSGRGSAATHREPIYAAPSSRRADSGYGEYHHRLASASPDAVFEEQTYVNDDQDTTIVMPTAPEEQAAGEEEGHADYLNRTFNTTTMRSFLRNEQETAMGRDTQMSTPTKQLGNMVDPRIPDTAKSVSSQASDPYSDRPQDWGPLNSTPIQEISLDNARPRNATIGETPILQGTLPHATTGSACSTRPPSSASLTTPAASFQLRTISDDDSLRSERRAIAPNDRPLQDAFPQRSLNNYQPRTPPLVVPSRSTLYQRAVAPPPRAQDDLRRAVIRNNVTKALSSSDEMQTPLRKLLPKANDAVVKELRGQLKATIAHMDLAMAHLNDKKKSLRQLYDHKFYELDREKVRLEQAVDKFHAEKDEWELEQKKALQRNKMDRTALKKREEELQQLAAQREKEANGKTVAAQTGAAELRVALNRKEEEIKKLKENCEKLSGQKARAEKLTEQMKANHAKDLKKKTERISELEKLLAAKENMESRRRPGIQPRQKQAATGGRRASFPEGRALTSPADVPSPYDRALRQKQPEYYAIPEEVEEEEQRKHVRWDDEGIQYQEYSPNVTATDHFGHIGVVQMQPHDMPMGIVHPFVDPWNRDLYMYRVRHNPEYGGNICGALLFKYHTNDAKWVYGPVDVYLHHKYPLAVKIHPLDIEIRISKDQIEIHRPSMEISRYNRLEGVVTDTRLRRDAGYYVVKNGVQWPSFQVIGRSDRREEEDKSVLRRGTMTEKKEGMEVVEGRDVRWFSESIRSPDVTEWHVHTFAHGRTNMRVGFKEQAVDIMANPAEDWVIVRHKLKNGQKIPCCDFGKPSRDRERSGQFVAFGSAFAKYA